MALLLFIDTSTRACSVALAEDEVLLAIKEEADTQSHAKVLQVFIEEVLSAANKRMSDLDGVVVAGGPGSYTGLRIGMSSAKGICFALDLPFIVVDTLEALASTMLEKQKDKFGVYMATLDSRKGEIYYALMNGKYEMITNSRPAVVDQIDINEVGLSKVYITGNTEDKLKEFKNRLKINDIFVEYSARNYINIGFNKFNLKHLDNLAYKEPNYLKPFQ